MATNTTCSCFNHLYLIVRGVIQSFVEKHFPSGVEQTKSMSIYDMMPNDVDDTMRTSKKRKSTHRRTTKRSISCDTNESSDDSDIECYSSFVQSNKRRSKVKHRDQNNNHPYDDAHMSDHDNSCESLLIEDECPPQQHTFAEILGQNEIEGGLPIQRVAKKDTPINVQHCKRRHVVVLDLHCFVHDILRNR
jgi:hypothetical protein